jgi:HK97 family phage prohead protease
MKLFAEITKIDRERRMVFGYASTEALDSQGEVVRKEAIEAALPDYMRFANIREMHQPSAVGVAKEAAIDDKGLYLAARIVDDEAWKKVTEGVYKGFSIGGRVTDRDKAQKHVITGVELLEISLVDRPANPEAVIELYKAAPRAPQQIWDCGSAGHRHLVKAEAVKCIEQAGASALAARAAPPPPPAGAALASQDTAVEAPRAAATPASDEPPERALDAALGLLAKVGARHSKSDLERVQKLHDTSVELGADCPAAAKRAAAAEPLLLRQLADLTKRVAVIEAQPMPPKGVTKLVAIGKEQDLGGAAAGAETVDGFVARLAAMTPDKRSHELTKLALRLPQRLPR